MTTPPNDPLATHNPLDHNPLMAKPPLHHLRERERKREREREREFPTCYSKLYKYKFTKACCKKNLNFAGVFVFVE